MANSVTAVASRPHSGIPYQTVATTAALCTFGLRKSQH